MKLLNVLKATSITMGVKDVRYYLNSVCIDFDQRGSIIRVISTDGVQLLELVIDDRKNHKRDDRLLLLPSAIKKLDAMLASDTDLFNVTKKEIVSIVEDDDLCDGKYPDVDRIIPALDREIRNENKDCFNIGLNVSYLSEIHNINNKIISKEKLSGNERGTSKAWKFNFSSDSESMLASHTYTSFYNETKYKVNAKFVLMPTKL